MRFLPILTAMAVLSLVTSCVASPPAPAPLAVAPPVRTIVPSAPVAPAVLPTDWRDWPQTPGDWFYHHLQIGSVATFGNETATLLSLRCDLRSGSIKLTLFATTTDPPGAEAIPTIVVVRATTAMRSIPVARQEMPWLFGASFAANDPLLDAIGFSRGRFVVEQPGAAPLVLPAWAEVERVVEDCRG